MVFKIEDFRKALGAGSRPNLFQVKVTLPTAYAVSGFEYVCRAASLPASTTGLIDIPLNGGRRLKMGGARQFPEWTTTVLNDENFYIRSNFEKWQADIAKTNFNLGQVGNRTVNVGATPSSIITGTVEIFQLDYKGESIGTSVEYKLFNCWPSDMSTIDLSYDSVDVVEEFTITWSYDYFTTANQSQT